MWGHPTLHSVVEKEDRAQEALIMPTINIELRQKLRPCLKSESTVDQILNIVVCGFSCNLYSDASASVLQNNVSESYPQ